MTLETLDRPPATDGSGGDTTDTPPIETRFPGGDDDESRRRQVENEIAQLRAMYDTETPKSVAEGWLERARDARTGIGYPVEAADNRHFMPVSIGRPATAGFFDVRKRSSAFVPDMSRGIGSFVAKASYRF